MITLRFVREPCLSSDLIAWFTQGHLSHVDCITKSGKALGARSDRVGGEPAGVWVRPADYAAFALVTCFELDATPAQEKAFYQFLNAQIGKPYDHRAIWGFVTGRDWREPDSWICSELQAAALEYAGIVPKLYVAANKITPNALALIASVVGRRIEETTELPVEGQ